MIDLIKCALLLIVFLSLYVLLGSLFLRIKLYDFSFSLAAIVGFLIYYCFFNLFALPCILLQQSLSLLIIIWIPVLCILLFFAVYICHDMLSKHILALFIQLKSDKAQLLVLIPTIFGVLTVLYISATSYYVGWDTAFYVRTTLHAVQNDSMYTLEGMSAQTAQYLSLRYALSPFYMNAAIGCRIMNLHPLLVQNLVDGSVCVILAFAIIFQIGLFIFKQHTEKAFMAVFFAALLHICHVSLFSSSEFLLTRSYEAKAYCANIILPFVFLCYLKLWKKPDDINNWLLLFFTLLASNAISMSSLFTVPALVAICSVGWLITRNWQALKRTILCIIPNIGYLCLYLLEYTGILQIPIR